MRVVNVYAYVISFCVLICIWVQYLTIEKDQFSCASIALCECSY